MMATISPPYRLLCDRCRRESDVLLPLRVEGAARPGWWLCPRCHRIVSRQVELVEFSRPVEELRSEVDG